MLPTVYVPDVAVVRCVPALESFPVIGHSQTSSCRTTRTLLLSGLPTAAVDVLDVLQCLADSGLLNVIRPEVHPRGAIVPQTRVSVHGAIRMAVGEPEGTRSGR